MLCNGRQANKCLYLAPNSILTEISREIIWRTPGKDASSQQAWGHEGGGCLCKPVGREEIMTHYRWCWNYDNHGRLQCVRVCVWMALLLVSWQPCQSNYNNMITYHIQNPERTAFCSEVWAFKGKGGQFDMVKTCRRVGSFTGDAW